MWKLFKERKKKMSREVLLLTGVVLVRNHACVMFVMLILCCAGVDGYFTMIFVLVSHDTKVGMYCYLLCYTRNVQDHR